MIDHRCFVEKILSKVIKDMLLPILLGRDDPTIKDSLVGGEHLR